MEREPHWIKGIDRVAFVVIDKRNVTGKHMDVLFAAGAAVRMPCRPLYSDTVRRATLTWALLHKIVGEVLAEFAAKGNHS
jgi:hypothetical protein